MFDGSARVIDDPRYVHMHVSPISLQGCKWEFGLPALVSNAAFPSRTTLLLVT